MKNIDTVYVMIQKKKKILDLNNYLFLMDKLLEKNSLEEAKNEEVQVYEEV
jgi:hypothetical protein